MTERKGVLSSFWDMLVPVHSDGHKFVALGAGLTLLLFLIWPGAAMLALLVTLWLAYFFRDPDRVTPLRTGLLISPADGRLIAIEDVRPPQELGFGETERTRLSIHLTLFDVHINRAPIAGRVVRALYVPGAFSSPTLDKASEDNERRATIIATSEDLEIAVVQIAGVVSRRIVAFAAEGDSLVAGQRFGLIRFGSRVDVYLPPGLMPLVAVGQRMVAGETVLADLLSTEGRREGRRG